MVLLVGFIEVSVELDFRAKFVQYFIWYSGAIDFWLLKVPDLELVVTVSDAYWNSDDWVVWEIKK